MGSAITAGSQAKPWSGILKHRRWSTVRRRHHQWSMRDLLLVPLLSGFGFFENGSGVEITPPLTALPATGYDHFCPWMGTAVAGGNINAFWSFLGSIVRGRGHSSVAQTRKMHRVVCRVVYRVLLLFCMGACGYTRPYAHQICS